MTLFEEVQQLSSESYDKWFERYFKKYQLEEKIKQSAKQGYSGYLIHVMTLSDEYTKRRLADERTLVRLRELLGDGFKVDFKLFYSRNIFTNRDYVSDKKIHITW